MQNTWYEIVHVSQKVPVRKGPALLTSCGIPSSITGNQILPGKYLWYVHLKRRKNNNKKTKKKYKKGQKRNKRTEGLRKNKKQTCANSARRVPTGQGYCCCWYDQSYDVSSWWTNRRTPQKEQTASKSRKVTRVKRADGKQKKRAKTKSYKNKQRAAICLAGEPRTTHVTKRG